MPAMSNFKASPLLRPINGDAREPKTGNLMACEAALHDFRCAVIGEGGRGKTVESENGARVVVDRQKGLRPTLVVALARKAHQKDVQLRVATVEGAAIVLPCNRFLMPWRNSHAGDGMAMAAARSLAFAAGGFSSSSRTRKLSRSDSFR